LHHTKVSATRNKTCSIETMTTPPKRLCAAIHHTLVCSTVLHTLISIVIGNNISTLLIERRGWLHFNTRHSACSLAILRRPHQPSDLFLPRERSCTRLHSHKTETFLVEIFSVYIEPLLTNVIVSDSKGTS
jgi:hypothetical protein